MGADAAVKERGRPVVGTVREELPQGKYRVALDSRHIVVGHPADGTRKNFVRLLPGDRVEVELTPHDHTRCRIVKKLKADL